MSIFNEAWKVARKVEEQDLCAAQVARNRRDENAILVLAYPVNSWEPIRYIPRIKLPKISLAVSNDEIESMTIKSVSNQYVFPIASFKYFATVTISSKDKWMKNKDHTSIMKKFDLMYPCNFIIFFRTSVVIHIKSYSSCIVFNRYCGILITLWLFDNTSIKVKLLGAGGGKA